MRLGLRLLFAFFLVNGIAAFFLLRVFMGEIKPSAREVMEDMMVDTAHVLAELASDDLGSGRLHRADANDSRFAQHLHQYAQRDVHARIWGMDKRSLDYRIYLIDASGRVLLDSQGESQGQDFSQWRDVILTLRGEYGARSTRAVAGDDTSTVMHVSAPVWVDGRIAGVLTVAKPNRTVQAFIDRAENKLLVQGLWMLGLSAAVGVGVTLWMVWNVRRLRSYAQQVQSPQEEPLAPPPEVPRVPGELGDLAQAMEQMRLRLQGHAYIESYVRALTHELKSPVSALRGAGELLQEDLPEADRRLFATQVVQQSERLQHLIERLLELSKLEQRAPQHLEAQTDLLACVHQAVQQVQARAQQRGLALAVQGEGGLGPWDAELLALAIGNVLDNAIDFSPAAGRIDIMVDAVSVTVRDHGPGVPDYALPRLGERFYTTARPGGERSGSGLGLAIVRRVMALHGGLLRVENAQPGLRVTLDLRR
ncbi:two-component system sensor histidine kinase CreC [Curvibacter sp. APW13]|uniref:two-component system sensor histidine kinase CreC n=1 Tax=Curvibacter sp. APW13 TaxID=3077236 RepID=UPI0028DD9444|nr:two-component system sensor histidine kinase CreC [Curvibacter sp. APW13]MDT8990489.1 two-component system sensor histidine kinase CreC [Curvibacter sp. APW13]